jgi:vacuolar-type H+-ATPase subunit H
VDVLTALLAEEAAPWPEWVALPANLFAVGLFGYLVLTGRWKRTIDVDATVAAANEAADERVAAAEALAAEKIAGAGRELTLTRDRLAAVVADRDAWREAHAAEVEARRQSERTSSAALEAQGVTVRLLTALESLLAGRGTV